MLCTGLSACLNFCWIMLLQLQVGADCNVMYVAGPSMAAAYAAGHMSQPGEH